MSKNIEGRRIVVTGIGMVTPLGNDRETTWKNALAGKTGIVPNDLENTEIRAAGKVQNYNFLESMRGLVDRSNEKRISLPVQYALTAATEAMRHAGILDDKNKPLTDEDRTRFGIRMGTGIGGAANLTGVGVRVDQGKRLSVYDSLLVLPERIASVPSMRLGLEGPVGVVVAACASGNMAITEGVKDIRGGDADIMLVGGAEAATIAPILNLFHTIRALSPERDDSKIPYASKPFDEAHDGFVMGEGAGILVIESLEHAQKYNRRIYAEITGYGNTADAAEDTAPDPHGRGAERAFRLAIKGVEHLMERGTVYINAHGTSTPTGDPIELSVLRRVSGNNKNVHISSTKGMTGHLLGAAGGIEAAFSVMALDKGELPPTINLKNPILEGEGVDLVPNDAKPIQPDVVVNNAFGFGGLNSVTAYAKLER